MTENENAADSKFEEMDAATNEECDEFDSESLEACAGNEAEDSSEGEPEADFPEDSAEGVEGDSPEDEACEGLEEIEEYEEIELEFSEDDIVSYLVDEDGTEIGFTLLDEEGNEVEYYYAEEDEEDEASSGANGEDDDNPYDFGITREGVADATNDMNAIYKDGIAVAAELKGAFDDIKSALDFSSVLKK